MGIFGNKGIVGRKLLELYVENVALRTSNAALRENLRAQLGKDKGAQREALVDIVDKARAILNAGHVGGRPETLVEACERVVGERAQARRDAEDAERDEDALRKELADVRRVANDHAAGLGLELAQKESTIESLKRQIGDLVRARKRLQAGTSPEELVALLERDIARTIRAALGIPTDGVGVTVANTPAGDGRLDPFAAFAEHVRKTEAELDAALRGPIVDVKVATPKAENGHGAGDGFGGCDFP